tara:strand:+ start:480 stop:1004 length:525 start_codon:yes stop_codon:yes gene_type:complete
MSKATSKAASKQQEAMNDRLAAMTVVERVEFLLTTTSRYAKWDRDTAAFYIRELINMNGGVAEFLKIMPSELDHNVATSWKLGRRQPSPITMRLIVNYLNTAGAKTGKINSPVVVDQLRKDVSNLMDQEVSLVDKISTLRKQNKTLTTRACLTNAKVKELRARIAHLESVMDKM